MDHDHLPHQRRDRVGGWGRATASAAIQVQPGDEAAWARLIAAPGPRGVIARGAGSGYGDSAQNAGGLVALTATAAGPIDLDASAGLVTVGAGVLLRHLMDFLVPLGWTVPVLPGTTEVSVGGAIAADVHGKNHPEAGAFSAYVVEMDILTPGLGLLRVGPHDQPDDLLGHGGRSRPDRRDPVRSAAPATAVFGVDAGGRPRSRRICPGCSTS